MFLQQASYTPSFGGLGLMKNVRVFLVGDHYVVCEGLRRMLEQEEEICVVGDAESGEEAIDRLRNIPADVVLLDGRLAGMDGIEALRKLKISEPELKVIMLTSYGEEFMSPAIEAGADGFLLKRGNRAEMVNAIHEVVKGGQPLDSLVIPTLLNGLRNSSRRPEISLSGRELQVLELAAGGLSNREIAMELDITEQTVKNHITSVLRKLDVNDRTHAVTVALRKGWISNPIPANWKTYG